jgi:hypothetical protein
MLCLMLLELDLRLARRASSGSAEVDVRSQHMSHMQFVRPKLTMGVKSACFCEKVENIRETDNAT